MLRAHLTEEKRCYGHPHRVVRTACARCRVPFCDECLTTRTDGVFGQVVVKDEKHLPPLFCDRCVAELEALNVMEAERYRPWWQRLRPTRAGVQRAAIYLAVSAVIMVPMTIAVRNVASTTLTPEEFARFAIAARGTFDTAEGTDLLSEPYGGRFIRANYPSQPNHGPERLIDTFYHAGVPGWRSADASVPQELVFAMPAPLGGPLQLRINKVILRPQPVEPEDTWVKDFEVLVSTEGPDRGFHSVGRWTLDVQAARAGTNEEQPNPPRFEFDEVPVKFVMLRVYANHGSSEYISLAEFEVYWVKK